MADRFLRLRHDAVVGGDDENDDVGHLRSARAHHRECFVTGSIEERDLPVALFNVISADVLRDSAGLPFRDIRLADGVEERGLPVVDVAHDGDDRTAGNTSRRACLLHRFQLDRFLERDELRLDVETACDLDGEILSEGRIDRDHESLLHQKVLHEVVRFHAELVGELLDCDTFRQNDLPFRFLEFENAARNGSRLLARVATARGSVAHVRLILRVANLARNDLSRREVVIEDGRRRERTLGEKICIDLRPGAGPFAALAGRLLLLRTLVLVIGFLAPHHRGIRNHPGGRRRHHATDASCAGS